MRTYITLVMFNKFNPNIPDLCYICKIHQVTLYHCLRDCVEVKRFWTSVTRYISQITSLRTPLSPKLCILSIYPEDCSLSVRERKMVNLCLLQARRSIALCWENVGCPSLGHRLNNLTLSLALEKLTYILRKKASEFYTIWELFLEFIKKWGHCRSDGRLK